MGGVPKVERGEDADVVVRGKHCPFGAVVSHHPAVCTMAEALLAHLTGRSVRQACAPDGNAPQCRFVFEGPETDADAS
jgi:predicted ArsR family transcriptional regulator